MSKGITREDVECEIHIQSNHAKHHFNTYADQETERNAALLKEIRRLKDSGFKIMQEEQAERHRLSNDLDDVRLEGARFVKKTALRIADLQAENERLVGVDRYLDAMAAEQKLRKEKRDADPCSKNICQTCQTLVLIERIHPEAVCGECATRDRIDGDIESATRHREFAYASMIGDRQGDSPQGT